MLQLNFWISELAAKTGVSTRTIRYYIEEGLLPQPEIQGKYAVFNDDYLYRLQLIKYLKDAFLPLREIKNRIDGMSNMQIEDLVKRFEQDPSSALASIDYSISNIEPLASINENAQDYISRVLQPKEFHRYSQITPAPDLPSLQSPPRPTTQPVQESWQRIEVMPGVELHIRQPVPSRLRRNVSELIQYAKNLFNRED